MNSSILYREVENMKAISHKFSLLVLLAVLFFAGSAGSAWAADAYTAIVNQNTRIDVQITDTDGHAVAPGRDIDDIKYIIKSKPEGAKASVYTSNSRELKETGKFTFGFTCDMPGTVEVETFVTVKDAPKYYTGIHTIQVVEEQAEPAESKIVIMSIGSAQIIVDNTVVKTDTAPLIQNGRTYVPLRALSNIFDAACDYNSDTQEITIKKGNTMIAMPVGENQFTINGENKSMDAPAYINDNGRTMVPLRFIANAFGAVIKLTYAETGAVADIMLQV